MILYRFAKWMEERSRLTKMIAETEGDSSVFLHKKEQVERQMLRYASKWLAPRVEAADRIEPDSDRRRVTAERERPAGDRPDPAAHEPMREEAAWMPETWTGESHGKIAGLPEIAANEVREDAFQPQP